MPPWLLSPDRGSRAVGGTEHEDVRSAPLTHFVPTLMQEGRTGPISLLDGADHSDVGLPPELGGVSAYRGFGE